MGFSNMDFYWAWYHYFQSWVGKRHREYNQLPMRQWRKKQIHKIVSILIAIALFVLGKLVLAFAMGGSLICAWLSDRTEKQEYGIGDREENKANMKRALNLFYYAAFPHSLVCTLWTVVEEAANTVVVGIVSRQYGLSLEVLHAYLRKTKQMCVNDTASSTSWNLITYGAGLLDSSLPEEYAAGGRVLSMLVDKSIASQIRRLLIRSPRQRTQKLIGTLTWRSPQDQEMRCHAARIVEHLAGDINLAHFPGALECISSLFDQETLLLTSIAPQGTDEDLVLQGLRILENLAHNRHNCTLIYNTKDLLSKIVAPVSSNELIEDIKFSPRWTMVLDGSLKVVSRLMSSPGSTGEEMRNLIANDGNVVNNLEAVMEMDIKSNDSIIKLQMQAMEVLTQLALHHPASASATKTREKLIERALQIFLTADWMEDYLTYEKSRMKEAKETASRLQEKAGEALAMLSSDSEAIKSFTGCDDDVNRLTKLLDSNIKTIKCKIGATDTVETEINIGCRISAAVILRHLKNYVKTPTLRKVLGQLLQDEPLTIQSHIKQCWDRRLQAELLSLVTAIRANKNLNLAGILLSQTPPDTLEDFVVMLKKLADGNMHATPACLAIQKLTCEMVIEFMKHDRNVEMISNHNIIGTLVNASRKLARLECSMIFAGIDRDCHGIPLKPRLYVLANKAKDLLTQRKQALGINIVPAGAPVP